MHHSVNALKNVRHCDTVVVMGCLRLFTESMVLGTQRFVGSKK